MGIKHQPDVGRSEQHGEILARQRYRRASNGILLTLAVAVEAAWIAMLVAGLVWLVRL